MRRSQTPSLDVNAFTDCLAREEGGRGDGLGQIGAARGGRERRPALGGSVSDEKAAARVEGSAGSVGQTVPSMEGLGVTPLRAREFHHKSTALPARAIVQFS